MSSSPETANFLSLLTATALTGAKRGKKYKKTGIIKKYLCHGSQIQPISLSFLNRKL